MDVTVAGFDDSPLRFDQMVLSINEAERLLGTPFPSPNVTMERVAALPDDFCGYNAMSYAPRYRGDPYVVDGSVISVRVDNDCDDTFATIAHEVAHTWFHGNDRADWIDEGLANALELQVVNAYHPEEPAYPPVTYCKNYGNVRQLEGASPARISNDQYSGFNCNYTLGDGIFGALRDYHGEAEFNARISRLARKETNRTNREHTIADSRRFLGDDAEALEIIDLWYEGFPEMRKFRHLDAVEWTFPPTTDGEYFHFHGKTNEPGLVHDFVLGDALYCPQFVLREGIADQEWVANVSRPLPAGWTHDEGSVVITINHDINRDTGEFRVTARILDRAISDTVDLSLSFKERVTTGGDGMCDVGITYSQIPVVIGKIPAEFKQAEYFHLDAVEWTFPPTIDGDYLYFAGKTTDLGLVHDFVLGDDPFCSQFSLYRNVINQVLVATIRDPLPARWTHNEIPDVVVVNDRIDPTTGEFAVTARINDISLVTIYPIFHSWSKVESKLMQTMFVSTATAIPRCPSRPARYPTNSRSRSTTTRIPYSGSLPPP